ncbi:L,D-transpeptidase [Aestuariivirga sp.]|uniref:L,D-transpeptidase n=1 Tax=Aestuariivirga sp. TaxID=2650926 RepID=UPI003BAA6CC9
MRLILIYVILALSVLPAGAQQAFTPRTFQIWGGIEDGSTAITRETQGIGLAPEDRRSRVVSFTSALPPGSIVVKTGARLLYFILPDGKAVEYEVGVGREGFTWSGTDTVSRKAQWPDWRPPPEMIARERRRGHELASFVPGGPDNPLGARAIYIGSTAFRIHGTNQAWSIGNAVSSGCIRMMNADIVDLYDRVSLGAAVVVEE